MKRTMRGRLLRYLRRAVVLASVVVATLLGARAFDAWRSAPLSPWHTFAPEELSRDELQHATWERYLAAEQRIFAEVRARVSDRLPPELRTELNRYAPGSRVYPGNFATDWNRSTILAPGGAPRGAAVFLHGLTDAPYSLRHIAQRYREAGFVSVIIRMPGHGATPGGLTGVEWEDWLAATHLAVREARKRSGPGKPLHVIGYSNGGALALMYAMDAMDNAALAKPDRLVLLSPMVGVTAFARFAGLAGLPAIFPAFAKSAWLGVQPEFNPFKFNSFPVNAARQSHLLTSALQQRLLAHARDNRWQGMPPVLTFQSTVDATVSSQAVIDALYAQLPANGSELVLFDINRAAHFAPLFRPGLAAEADRIKAGSPRRFRLSVITANGSGAAVARVTEAGAATEQTRDLGLSWPRDVFSLSHVALPFPMQDGLYGLTPDPADNFGVTLGALAIRGERGALVIGMDTSLRMSSNPFYPYMISRIMADVGLEKARR
ncbi:alpha-beta hydrolase superfamily lysophospholipase [Camelimonas lactis]|uniref:Alpha-beta hydrolase superfamily lysophospholipase n=2 Tax=Camelimonas lactis TaxID=659006 RepID=A0A4R2GXU8_9HYPH|nr:alpha-beta hydrolase superfamily lysophospholipase [Camelimonas lactis]